MLLMRGLKSIRLLLVCILGLSLAFNLQLMTVFAGVSVPSTDTGSKVFDGFNLPVWYEALVGSTLSIPAAGKAAFANNKFTITANGGKYVSTDANDYFVYFPISSTKSFTMTARITSGAGTTVSTTGNTQTAAAPTYNNHAMLTLSQYVPNAAITQAAAGAGGNFSIGIQPAIPTDTTHNYKSLQYYTRPSSGSYALGGYSDQDTTHTYQSVFTQASLASKNVYLKLVKQGTVLNSYIYTLDGTGNPTYYTASAASSTPTPMRTADTGTGGTNPLNFTPDSTGNYYVGLAVSAGTFTFDNVSIKDDSNGGVEIFNSNSVGYAVPDAPAGLQATPGDLQVSLKWNAVLGASFYNIWRSAVSGSGYVQVGSSSTTSYTDSTVVSGKTYYYVITASNTTGASAYSNEANAIPSGRDLSTLQLLIGYSGDSYAAAVEGTKPGQYPSGAKTALQSAIQAAMAVVGNTGASQQDVDNAAMALNNALRDFKQSVYRVYDKIDANKDGAVGIGDIGSITTQYGKNSGSSDWSTASAADINQDGKVDIQDLAVVAGDLSGAAIAAPSYKFNFTGNAKEGYNPVIYNSGVPLYNPSMGYGFVRQTNAMPAREVHTASITSDGTGFKISEPAFYTDPTNADNYNHYGMAFRISAPPGAYQVYVKTTSDASVTTVAVSGMQSSRILKGGYWDSASLVPINTFISASGNEWTYKFVNGRNFIDVEIEPGKVNTPVGVQEIVLTPIAAQQRPAGSLPTVFTLGDSTVKSYTFDEAPMSGWGQMFDKLFDKSKVNVVNYAQGGRSFKTMHTEGRFNDVLMTGKIGDYVLVQSGHNDESTDESARFGRGATEAMYEAYIRDMYIPAIRARGMIPVLVTPMTRINGTAAPGYVYTNSFTTRKFPDIMKRAAADLGVTVLDLNTESVKYANEIGVDATSAIIMSIEAGETPGKTNDGSYANGYPGNKIDGTHYKEALAKQYARILATEISRKGSAGDRRATNLASYLRQDVKGAIQSGDWSAIYPEMTKDTTTGPDAYYRNQIEKLLRLGIMSKDSQGNFNPNANMTVSEFIAALCKTMSLNPLQIVSFTDGSYTDGALSREVAAAILDDAYHAKYGTAKVKYMTDYNGTNVVPGDPNYDPNLTSNASNVMYYPLVSYEQLTDKANISPGLASKVQDAYNLGLIRSEKGIQRGKMVNGTEFEPQAVVTRAKAAKLLYYMWVLVNPVNVNNDLSVTN